MYVARSKNLWSDGRTSTMKAARSRYPIESKFYWPYTMDSKHFGMKAEPDLSFYLVLALLRGAFRKSLDAYF